MNAYPIEKLIKLWETERINQERATGQILLLLRGLQQQIYELERRVARTIPGAPQKEKGERREARGFQDEE
jgi:hypothetical protein